MKVAFYSFVPFSFAHGGLQAQITQTRRALESIGVATDFLRWYDDRQSADILHFFGRAPLNLVRLAHKKGMKIVFTELLTEQGSRSPLALRAHRFAVVCARTALPNIAEETFGWGSYKEADACVALTAWEAYLMSYLFGTSKGKVHLIPNGVEEVFFESAKATRGPWLICTATITERKRVLELARAAVIAKTPLWIIGKPYSESEPYARRFLAFARDNPEVIRFEGAISDRAQLARICREARGFVLLSAMESLSLSALEAAACECPLLLSDLPWARTTFNDDASYCKIVSPSQTSFFLKQFYDAAPNLKPAPRPPTWIEIAERLKKLYENLMAGPARSK